MPATDDRVLRLALLALGVFELGLGLLMLVAPGTFFSELGPFGTRNDHYIRDAATWELALAAGAFAAAGRPSWRVPVLFLAAVHFVMHAINHLVDIGDADPEWIGVFDFVLLGGAAVALVIVWRRAAGGEGGRP